MRQKAVSPDAIDRRITAALRLQGSITNQPLSEKVGLLARPCLERVRKLEATGLIATTFALKALKEFEGYRWRSRNRCSGRPNRSGGKLSRATTRRPGASPRGWRHALRPNGRSAHSTS